MQQAAPGASTSVPAGVLDVAQPHFEADLEINDFPQHARWKARCQHLPVAFVPSSSLRALGGRESRPLCLLVAPAAAVTGLR